MITTRLYQDDDSRWHAVRTRDINADGFFFYGVRSTRIYCRPACKARLARRANVSFYADGTEAEAAGFRACKRCKPEVVGFMPEEKAVRRIKEFVIAAAAAAATGDSTGDDYTRERMSLSAMAKEVGLSKWHFHRVFKKCVGVTPVEYLRMMRQNRLPDLETLSTGYETVLTATISEGQEDFSWMTGDGLDAMYNPLEGQPTDSSSSSSYGGPLEIDPSLDDILSWPDDWWNASAG